MKNTTTLALGLLVSSGSWAQASFFERTAGPQGNVVQAPGEVRPPELQGIQLLPLECVGRTQLTVLLEGATQRRTDVPGAARLRLPHEGGSLYKYSRAEADGTSAFGHFLVGAEGRARRVFELAGTGPGGTQDPLPGRVAVHSGGSSLLVASSPAAGGDLWEVDLLGGTAENRTQGLGPLEFGRNSLVLLDGWGLGVSTSGVVRFDRLPGAQASVVVVPASLPWFGPDVVHSADGSTVAFVAGMEVNRAFVFSCARTGASVQASDQPMAISGGGFLPEQATGPHLALSSDGSWVAWRVSGSSSECFARETRAGQRPANQHLTGPSSFDNTLNDTGVIAFFDPDSLVLVAGRSEDDGVARADLYRLDLDSCGASCSARVENLTRTSGITRPPYDYGHLETSDGIFRAPDAPTAFLVHDAEDSRLLWVREDGARPLLDDVRSLESVEVAGTHLVAAVRRPPGLPDPFREGLSLVQIPPSGVGPIVVPLPAGCHMTRTVGSRSSSVYVGVLEFPNGDRLGRVSVPSPNGVALSTFLFRFGPTVGIADGGAVVATLELATDRAAFSWSELGTQLLRTSRVESFLLPGP